MRASNRLAIERGQSFQGFADSKYASGEYFDQYTEGDFTPRTPRVAELFEVAGIRLPTRADWQELKASVMAHGLFNRNLQAIPPTGSISYINHSNSSIHPIVAKVEIRKEGKLGASTTRRPTWPTTTRSTTRTPTRSARKRSSTPMPRPPAMSTRDVADAVLPRHRHHPRHQSGADLRLEEGHQDALLHPPAPGRLEGTEVQGCVSCSL